MPCRVPSSILVLSHPARIERADGEERRQAERDRMRAELQHELFTGDQEFAWECHGPDATVARWVGQPGQRRCTTSSDVTVRRDPSACSRIRPPWASSPVAVPSMRAPAASTAATCRPSVADRRVHRAITSSANPASFRPVAVGERREEGAQQIRRVHVGADPGSAVEPLGRQEVDPRADHHRGETVAFDQALGEDPTHLVVAGHEVVGPLAPHRESSDALDRFGPRGAGEQGQQSGVDGLERGTQHHRDHEGAPGPIRPGAVATATSRRLVTGSHQGPFRGTLAGHDRRRRVGGAGNLIPTHGGGESCRSRRPFEIDRTHERLTPSRSPESIAGQ